MLHRFKGVYHRYLSGRTLPLSKGVQLRDEAGTVFANAESIGLRGGHLELSGWTTAERVELRAGEFKASARPSLPRLDVARSMSLPDTLPTGFRLEIPFFGGDATATFITQDARHILSLTDITPGKIRIARLRALPRFLTKLASAAPMIVKYNANPDRALLTKIKSALELDLFERSIRLDPNILDSPKAPTPDIPRVTIILPIYNAFDLVQETLRRLTDHTPQPFDLILIEDCSTDDRIRPYLKKWTSKQDPKACKIELIEHSENQGFIKSVNEGFARARALDQHVVLLNSDAHVPQNWLPRLIAPLLKGDKIASVTPMSNDAEILSAPTICQRSDLAAGAVDLIDETAARLTAPSLSQTIPTGVGFCMAIGSAALNAAPDFDESFGRGYGEEVDWCQRLRATGGTHLALANLFVDHRGGASFGSDEKLRLITENNAKIARRYPSYDAEVQDFIAADPLLTARLAIGIAIAGQASPLVPVYLAHSLGGGAENYLKDRIATDLEEGQPSIVLRVGGQARFGLELHSPTGVTRGETEDFAIIARLLESLPQKRILYSCGVGDPDPVSLPRRLVDLKGPGDTLDILIHDFFALSPSYCLLDQNDHFTGVPEADDPDRAHNNPTSLTEWRAAWSTLFDAADSVITFSKDSAKHVARAYPNARKKIKTKPHKLLHPVPKIVATPNVKPVIAVLGNIGLQKGARVVAEMARKNAGSEELDLMVLGNVDPNIKMPGDLTVHGGYNLDDLPDLAARYGIAGWAVPSIWPETFSYTTHEALATGLPVFVFDLGAQAEAAKPAPNGIVVATDGKLSLADAMLQAITSEFVKRS